MLHAKFPNDPAEMQDFRKAVEAYVLPGYAPEAPIFSLSAKVVTAGSCFASNLAQSLLKHGVAVRHLQYGEDHNSAAATAALIEESIDGKLGDEVREALMNADLFILTMGVAVVAFLDGKPTFRMSKSIALQAKWHLLAPDMISKYTIEIIDRLKAINPKITVVLTESPLPLNVALDTRSPFVQDCVAKSSIRFGLELVMREEIANVHYWPSFEMVRWLAPHRGQVFGTEEADNRHIPQSVVNEIVNLFFEKFFSTR